MPALPVPFVPASPELFEAVAFPPPEDLAAAPPLFDVEDELFEAEPPLFDPAPPLLAAEPALLDEPPLDFAAPPDLDAPPDLVSTAAVSVTELFAALPALPELFAPEPPAAPIFPPLLAVDEEPPPVLADEEPLDLVDFPAPPADLPAVPPALLVPAPALLDEPPLPAEEPVLLDLAEPPALLAELFADEPPLDFEAELLAPPFEAEPPLFDFDEEPLPPPDSVPPSRSVAASAKILSAVAAAPCAAPVKSSPPTSFAVSRISDDVLFLPPDFDFVEDDFFDVDSLPDFFAAISFPPLNVLKTNVSAILYHSFFKKIYIFLISSYTCRQRKKRMKTDVIIVGAGPTGLALAVQFIRYGVDFVICDQKETTTPHSKAIGVQARTLEIYEQINLSDQLIGQGARAEKARLIVGGEVRGEIEFGELGRGLSPYPYVLLVEQGKHEKLLYDHLRANGRDVLWRAELEGFEQDDSGVRASVKKSGGEIETIEAKYLIGCDGAKSPVRHRLGLAFEGSTFERMFYVADVEIDWDFAHDALMVFLMKDNLLAFFPMVGGERHFRIVGTFPEEFAGDEGEILYEEIEGQIKKDAGLELDITKVHWFSTYKVHTRHARRFSEGRCFLAGDAAHIHTPAGAQGMNTGIQDGYNLAWKLALVLRGKAGEKILETYNEERLENAINLLQTTDRFFNLVASPDKILSYLRMHVFPLVAGVAFSLDAVKKFVFPRISQIGISYERSSLSETAGKFRVRAGDRMPYFETEGASVYDRLREPKFHLLTFSAAAGGAEFSSAEMLENYSDIAGFDQMPLDAHISEIFGADETFTVLLRPDNYIGTIFAGFAGSAPEKIKSYFERVL